MGCYNKPFLDAAIARGDPIQLSTIPSIMSDVKRNGQSTRMFGKEIEYLVKKNAKPVNIGNEKWKMIKSGFNNDFKWKFTHSLRF